MGAAGNRDAPIDGAASAVRVRILVVDDSAVSRSYILGALAGLPAVEVDAVDSGAHALRAIKQGGYSLLLCDYEMPDMSGLQVLRFVRTHHTAVELPVLMLTSREEADVKVRAFRAGANDYIAKQAQPEELLARVSTQIELLEAHRRLSAASVRAAEGQRFEAVGHLAEALAHELNTPAQYITDNLSFLSDSLSTLQQLVAKLRTFSDGVSAAQIDALLMEADCDYLFGQVPRCIDESQKGIAQVARIIAVMRDFGQRGAQEPTAQDLNEIVRGALAVAHGQLHHAAELTLELDSALPAVVCIGASIKQIVLQAIMNAVRAMKKAEGARTGLERLQIRTRREADAWACIEIADNGRALAPDVLRDVLDPVLGSSHAGETAQALGHMRGVVETEHAGKLEITSSDPAGTRIVIRLPIRSP
jgi:DNA-binding response OmpR family regulator